MTPTGPTTCPSTDRDHPVDFLDLVAAAGNPDRAFVFASTSKITFAGAGLGFVASSAANIKDLAAYIGKLSIGANKIEQLRHVRFLTGYPGGIDGLMSAHAALIAPKFAAVNEVLTAELGDSGLATWTTPKGGYFISLDTTLPVADRVVALAKAAGVSLTPAGAAFPGGDDPRNTHIRLAPTRPGAGRRRAGHAGRGHLHPAGQRAVKPRIVHVPAA